MATRKTVGEVIQRVKGKEYTIRVRMPPDDSHKNWYWSAKRKVIGNKTEAEAALVAYQAELDAGTIDSLSVASYAREFQNDREKRLENEREEAAKKGVEPRYTLSPETIKRDEIEIKRIEKNFKKIAVKDLSVADVSIIYKRLRKKGISENELHKLHQKLSQIMKQAVKEGRALSNPCTFIDDAKRPKANERESLSQEQVMQLTEDLQAEEKSGYIVATWLALTTGGRRGEILGLTWEDVDLKRKIIHFRKQLDKNKERRDLKTEKSKRTIAINDTDVAFLADWKTKISEDFFGGGNILFDTPVCINENGSWLDPNNFGKWRREWFADHGLGEFKTIKNYIDKQGRPHVSKSGYTGFDLHSLRHTHATLLIGNNVDIKTVQKRLGHSSATTTINTYAHAIDQNDRKATEIIGKLLETD